MLPNDLKPDYEPYFFIQPPDEAHWQLVKAADRICAYLKCLEELKVGNQEFAKAANTIKADIERIDLPEVAQFVEAYIPSFALTLDELN
jgi:5'-deoxynucleotidase